MRVIMMNDNFYRSSGAAIAIRRISEALSDVDYYVAGCDSGGLAEDLSWVPGGRFERFDLKSRNPIRVAREVLRFKQVFTRLQCDLVHCHHRRVSALLQLAGIPVLYTGQLTFPFQLWFRLLHPKRMTAVTPTVMQNLLETTGQKVLACIGNPAYFPQAPPSIELDRVKCKAVCVARLEPIKGHVHLLKAWKLLCARGYRYRLALVGEGPLRAQLEAQSLKDGTRDLIEFIGFTRDVASVISDSLFAILVSEREGQGIVTLEAAAMGRPSLLTSVPGSIDLLPPGRKLRNAIEFGNAIELADVLEEWFAHPGDVIRDGAEFFRYLKQLGDAKTIADEYRRMYQRVLGKATRADPSIV